MRSPRHPSKCFPCCAPCVFSLPQLDQILHIVPFCASLPRRYPRLDDQAIFWKVIRTSKKPAVLPIGKCRNFNSADDMASMFSHSGHHHTKYLISCVLDTCMFSSGMISNVYEPELTYGA